ncbi:hypothetical protein [Hymenobacter psychrophilus]|uniref:hypothetical protein n=1 Tax=Hymenobacter psychrophilus TaxID=651662 RepID=UPI0011148E36|nr:hypothetical protein [Hymenobacter psychrophilus]
MTTKKILIYTILLLTTLVGLQCKITHYYASQSTAYKAIYIDQFKLTYLRQILKKSYNNSKAIQEILSSDHSGFTEPVLTESDYELIDSLSTAHNAFMKVDSTQGYRRAEGAQGKRPLGFILDKVDSQWLDSLARQRLKLSGVPKSWTD